MFVHVLLEVQIHGKIQQNNIANEVRDVLLAHFNPEFDGDIEVELIESARIIQEK